MHENISVINPAIMKNTECLVVKAHALVIGFIINACTLLSIKIVGVLLNHSVPLYFVSSYFEHLW